MAERNRPLSKESAPNPANSYERADPDKEAGMGRLDNNKGTPINVPDSMTGGTPNKQDPEHQLNAEDVVDSRAQRPLRHKIDQ
ncbi:MAG TPA: hypothetical protein VG326_15160 [Tepidisphaeraceae bacterium]|nr:hypothetical protein [Tepidisphaeraceae bacterium]